MYFLKHIPGINYFLNTSEEDELITIDVQDHVGGSLKWTFAGIPEEDEKSKESRYKEFITAIDIQDFEKMEDCYKKAEKFGSIDHLMGNGDIKKSPIYHFTCSNYQTNFLPILEWFSKRKLLEESINKTISDYYSNNRDLEKVLR